MSPIRRDRMSKALLFSVFLALSWGLAACGAGGPALPSPSQGQTETPTQTLAPTSSPATPEPTPAPSVKIGPRVGERAPDFSLTTIDGQTITLSSFLGNKPFILYFFATW